MKKEKGYDPKADYCSLSPDTLFGVKFSYACYLHDRHYRNERKQRYSRKEADQLMRDHIFKRFNENHKKKLGFIVGNVYYYVMRVIGWRTWIK
jgi:hypothetical protein